MAIMEAGPNTEISQEAYKLIIKNNFLFTSYPYTPFFEIF